MNSENVLGSGSSARRSSESRCVTSQIYLFLLFSIGWYHENLANRQLVCAICEKYRKSPALITGTLYLKILSGAPKKLLGKVSVSGKYLFQGLDSRI